VLSNGKGLIWLFRQYLEQSPRNDDQEISLFGANALAVNKMNRCWCITRRSTNNKNQLGAMVSISNGVFLRKYSGLNSRRPEPSLIHHNLDCVAVPSRWDSNSAVVYPDIISEDVGTQLISILSSKFQRCVRYEYVTEMGVQR
jgi:hypothetical protein